MYFVYLIENLVNGKLYVGKTNDVKKRWATHRRVAMNSAKYKKQHHYLHKAIYSYGESSFFIRIIDSYSCEQMAYAGEREYILQLKTKGYYLYNLTDGGDGSFGHKISEETRAKMSLAQIGVAKSAKHKEKMSLAKIGRPRPKTMIRKVSGDKAGGAKLTWNDVNHIRELFELNVSQANLSRQFNVSRANIHRICNYTIWKFKDD